MTTRTVPRPRPSPVPRTAQPVAARMSRPPGLALPGWLAFLLAALAVGLLPVTAATTDLSHLGGLGLAGVLSVWGWVSIACAVLACGVEITLPRPRPAVLAVLTGVLVWCSAGMPSVVEPAARLSTAWLHSGFVDAIATTGRLPVGVDSRFSWAGFFSQWAWIRDAGGGADLDAVLRWFPPVVVAVWAVGVHAIARPLLGGARGPWVAVWVFVGANWVEQDYFSPQAIAVVLELAVLAAVLGPLATRRTDLAGCHDWPPSRTGAAPLPWWRRAAVAFWTQVRHPDLPPRQVLLVWAVCGLCALAVVVDHQATPFALGAQLFVLALAGRFWGRWLFWLLVLAELTWFILGAREFWTNQLALATNGIGNVGGSLASGLVARLTGDVGQLAVKLLRVVLALAVWTLAAVGAWRRWRRQRDLALIVAAFIPVVLAALQSYGGEILLRVYLYSLPLLAVLCVEAMRPLTWGRPRARPILAAGMAVLFAALVLVRGGNDAYALVRPSAVAIDRAVLAQVPPQAKVLGLTNQGPLRLARNNDVVQASSTPGCEALADDLLRCVDAEHPDVILVLPSMNAERVVLEGYPQGWTRTAVAQLMATGEYRVTLSQGLTTVLVRTGKPG